MSDQTIYLSRQSTRPSVLLPFHLMWYGRLSKKQGAIALQRGLIVARPSRDSALPDRIVHLTRRGRSGLKFILRSKEPNLPRVYAHLLEEWGHVTEERFYAYADTPMVEYWERNKNEL